MGFDHHLDLRALGVVTEPADAVRRVLEVRLLVASRAAVDANRVATQRRGAVDPGLVFINRAGALRRLFRVQLVLGIHQNEHVLHAFTRRAFHEFADVVLVRVLAAEGTVPVFDMRDAQLLFAKGRIIQTW